MRKMNLCLQLGRTNVLFRPVLSGLSLLTAIIVVVLLRPWCSDLYHLQVGAQALRQALGAGDELEWWYSGLQTVQDEQALRQSIAHLTRVRSQPYSQRLLGRAYAAQGDLLTSIQVLEQFTSAHPQHPLGHLELAAAYMLAEERWRTMYRVDLLASLSEATLSAPDLVGNARYVAEGWNSQYVYPTRFVLPPDGQARPTLFLHSGSQVTFTLTLTQPVVLRFGMGLDPRSLDWGGDGATFEVFVDEQRVFLEHLTIEMAREGWQEREVDLSAWSGQRIVLTLSTTPGPRADNTADWAGWGDVQLVEATRAGGVLAGAERRAVAAWRAGGISAQQLVEAGEERQRKGRYVDAIRLYRAAGIEGRIDTFEPAVPLSMVIIESFVDAGAWLPCNWCGNVDGRFETHNGVLEMSYKNNLEKRDGFAYLSRPDVLISNYRELLLRLKGESGTLLTVEIVVDGGRTRPLNYQPVPQDWDVWIIPIQGNVLNEILIGIGELEPVLTPLEYHLSIDWIALR